MHKTVSDEHLYVLTPIKDRLIWVLAKQVAHNHQTYFLALRPLYFERLPNPNLYQYWRHSLPSYIPQKPVDR